MLAEAAPIEADAGVATSAVPPVMFLADHLGYASGVSHGLTTYLLTVLPALAEAGVELTACFTRESHAAADVLHAHRIEPIFLNAGKLNPLVTLQIASIARERGCRILHATQMKATLAARVVAPLIGARTIVHVHDLNRMNLVARSLHRAFARDTDLGLCVADVVQDLAVSDYAVRRGRVCTLHNGLPLERFRSVGAAVRARLRDELDLSPERPVLGLIGRMFPVKGQRRMLQMMPGILRRRPDAVLLLVGDGPDRAGCAALASELGIEDSVRFVGQRSDIAELVTVCSIVVLPSESEGLPLTAIEALAAGRPVVAYDVGGMREVVDDGQSGLVVAAGDSAAFTEAVLSLLENPVRLAAFGARTLTAAERFGVEHHVQRLLRHYRTLAAGAATRR